MASTRITKAEAEAAARALENVLAGNLDDAEFLHDGEDADRLHALLSSVAAKLWERTR